MPSRRAKIIFIAGLCFIAIGLVFNEWLVKSLMSNPTSFGMGKRLLLLAFQAGCIGLGALFVWRREKAPVAQLALCAVVTLLCLGAAELALRAFAGTSELRVFCPNPHGTGSYRLKPNLDYDFRAKVLGKMVTFDIKTNSFGMRWREVTKEKPAGKQRIAFLGDSFTFGESADRVENSFTGVFESQIDTDKYEVLNFGIDGFGVDDEELYLKEDVIDFAPDYCVVMFFAGNDVRDTYLGLNKFDTSSGIAVWNNAVLDQKVPEELQGGRFYGGQVGSEKSFLNSIRLYVGARNIWKRISGEEDAEPVIETYDPATLVVEEHFTAFSLWTRTDYTPAMLRARDATLKAFDGIRRFCDEKGIKLMIAAIPMQRQVYSSAWEGVDPQGIPFDIRRPQCFVEAFAAENAIPYLDLLPVLREYVETTHKDVFPDIGKKGGDIHLNNEGHAVAGHALAGFFKQTFVEPPAEPTP